QEIPLHAELDLLGLYLAIQKVRFGERLRVTIAVDESARAATVPVLLFQPLVENAIRHGLARRVSSGCIDITARRDGARLVITVTDDGGGAGAASAAVLQDVTPGAAVLNAAGHVNSHPIAPAASSLAGGQTTARERVGLGNTRARLEALYGTRQRLDLATVPDRGACVSLEIPF